MQNVGFCKVHKSFHHLPSLLWPYFWQEDFEKLKILVWNQAKRNATCFFACYFVVASLNLDLSRGQILNDAKSIKNSKASTFLRAQIVAKKKIRPFFLSVKVLTRRTMRRRTSCENRDFNFAIRTGSGRRYFSEGLIRKTLNRILWDKVIGS